MLLQKGTLHGISAVLILKQDLAVEIELLLGTEATCSISLLRTTELNLLG